MISDGKSFDTNAFFTGGAGMFIQYHDVIKPVYLFAIFKMLLTKQYYGLPFEIIKNLSVFSLLEWYVKRRYINPLQCLDYMRILDIKELDDLILRVLNTDESIYKLSPGLNIRHMLSIYKQHHRTLSFPVFVYSKYEEANIPSDCKRIFPDISIKYVYGNLKEAISKCDNNFTYILSDIEIVKELSELLMGTYSHILISKDYRYNYIDNCNTFKYDLLEMAKTHPFIRVGITPSMDMNQMVSSFNNIIFKGGK